MRGSGGAGCYHGAGDGGSGEEGAEHHAEDSTGHVSGWEIRLVIGFLKVPKEF